MNPEAVGAALDWIRVLLLLLAGEVVTVLVQARREAVLLLRCLLVFLRMAAVALESA